MISSSSSAYEDANDWPIVGHVVAVSMLKRSLLTGQLSHAYLFTGPPGIGKRTLALAFAMAANCQAYAGASVFPDVPCGLCSSCAKIARGAHPDVVELNLRTQALALDPGGKGKGPREIRIDAVRDMQSTVGLQPYSGRRKFYILGDADHLNEEAANCILKTLEEPPPHTILLLLADDDQALLPTISSRCLHVPLRPLPRALVAANLEQRWNSDAEHAALLSALSGGRLGYAISLLTDKDALDRRKAALERLALLSGSPTNDRIGVAGELARLFTDARPELYELLDTWEGWWRDVAIVGGGAAELSANVDQNQMLASNAKRVSVGRARSAVDLVQATRVQLQENVNPRLALEGLTLGLP